jgi:hypothetical protein
MVAALFSPNVEQFLTNEVARKMHGKIGEIEGEQKAIVQNTLMH